VRVCESESERDIIYACIYNTNNVLHTRTYTFTHTHTHPASATHRKSHCTLRPCNPRPRHGTGKPQPRLLEGRLCLEHRRGEHNQRAARQVSDHPRARAGGRQQPMHPNRLGPGEAHASIGSATSPVARRGHEHKLHEFNAKGTRRNLFLWSRYVELTPCSQATDLVAAASRER